MALRPKTAESRGNFCGSGRSGETNDERLARRPGVPDRSGDAVLGVDVERRLSQVREDVGPSPVGWKVIEPRDDVEVEMGEALRLGEHDDVRLLTPRHLLQCDGRVAQ